MFALLRSSRSSTGWLRLSGAGEILTASRPEEVRPLIRRVEAEATAGKWLAGWLNYEAAAAFEPTIPVHPSSGPLAVFGIFDEAEEVELDKLPAAERSRLPTWTPLVDAKSQQQALTELKAAIFAGELYQANLSFRCAVELGDEVPLELADRDKKSEKSLRKTGATVCLSRSEATPGHPGFGGEPPSGVRGGSPVPPGFSALTLFRRLYQAQPVPFAALIELGPYCLISLSPELFLERRGQTLLSRPMKGTCARAASWSDDEERRRWLAGDPKSQAENVMIVDLMRNDLSRICRQNSVQVDSLFQVDRYTTLHQMVSQVSGELQPETSLEDILAATFPPGSVTGAPKIQACHLIHRLEITPRGAYTGIAGLIEPGGDFTFNVCIRTLEKQASGWSLGLGSGVVADSSTSLEWEECLLKGAFLRAEAFPSEIFTTLRWQDGKPIGLLPHLRRLRDSCRWFQRPFPSEAIFAQVRQWRLSQAQGLYRIRLAVNPAGHLSCRNDPLANLGWGKGEAVVIIAEEKVSSSDPWLRHKTSRRGCYDRALVAAKALGADEALIFNERDELAEGSFTSVFLRDNRGFWWTPPLDAGILPGIWRQEQIGLLGAAEKPLFLSDLLNAAEIRIGNSLRGGISARIRA